MTRIARIFLLLSVRVFSMDSQDKCFNCCSDFRLWVRGKQGNWLCVCICEWGKGNANFGEAKRPSHAPLVMFAFAGRRVGWERVWYIWRNGRMAEGA